METKVLAGRQIRQLALDIIKNLETDQGILASGKQEIYGCIFGRDSLLTAMQLLKACQRLAKKQNDLHKAEQEYLQGLVRKILLNLSHLQGREFNLESGEEKGKWIHEYRPTGHEHLTQAADRPWYVYPDNVMRNYDSLDSTPLFLIACYRYWQLTRDEEFFNQLMPSVLDALSWVLELSDKNGDGFADYQLPPQRKHGGLVTQNWMDSNESVFHEDGAAVVYPVAPVEVQGYVYLALRLWSAYFLKEQPQFGEELYRRAKFLKDRFNRAFVLVGQEGLFLASALDGAGKPITAVRSSMGHCLWAAQTQHLDGLSDCIVEDKYIPQVVSRLMQPDLFVPQAGLRTLSENSTMFEANSYHNGSIWPHDTAIVADGLGNFGYRKEQRLVRRSLRNAISHFATAVELFVYEHGEFKEYVSAGGQKACRQQAWSAAGLVNLFLA